MGANLLSDYAIARRLSKLRLIHGKEIGARVDETIALLEEIQRLRSALAAGPSAAELTAWKAWLRRL